MAKSKKKAVEQTPVAAPVETITTYKGFDKDLNVVASNMKLVKPTPMKVKLKLVVQASMLVNTFRCIGLLPTFTKPLCSC
jgi:hypothetical protein